MFQKHPGFVAGVGVEVTETLFAYDGAHFGQIQVAGTSINSIRNLGREGAEKET
jgi:hypothetical protein